MGIENKIVRIMVVSEDDEVKRKELVINQTNEIITTICRKGNLFFQKKYSSENEHLRKILEKEYNWEKNPIEYKELNERLLEAGM